MALKLNDKLGDKVKGQIQSSPKYKTHFYDYSDE